MNVDWILDRLEKNPWPADVLIPPKYQAIELGTLPPGSLRDTAYAYLNQFWTIAPQGRAPAFFGRARRGKSETAAAIARVVNQNPTGRLDVLWGNVPEARWKVETNSFDASTRNMMDSWMTCSFLVLDDVQVVERRSRFGFTFEALLSHRFDYLLPTLLTGNFDLPDGDEWGALTDFFGPMVGRRVQDAAQGYTVLV